MPFDIQERFILEAEKLLKCTLPTDYRRLMQEDNGGTVELDGEFWELFPIADKLDRKRISRTCNNIISETSTHENIVTYPKGALALASDGAGNILMFKRNAQGNGFVDNVYCWSHETGNTKEVAKTFGELEIE